MPLEIYGQADDWSAQRHVPTKILILTLAIALDIEPAIAGEQGDVLGHLIFQGRFDVPGELRGFADAEAAEVAANLTGQVSAKGNAQPGAEDRIGPVRGPVGRGGELA